MVTLKSGSRLALRHFQRVHNASTCLRRHDHVVHVATLSCLERVRKLVLVALRLLLDVLAAEDDLHCALGSHHSDLSARPGIVVITTQVLRGHHIVGASVCFSCDKSDLGHGSFSICVEDLSAVLDDTTVLLSSAGHKARNVNQSDEWDLESIAEANEASGFDRSIDVEHAGQDLWLVGHHADRLTLNLNKASENVSREVGHDLVELVPICDRLNHNIHVVGFVWVLRDDVVKNVSGGLVQAVFLSPNFVLSLLLRVLRQEAHELARARNRLNVILVNSVAHSRDLRVHFGSTETLFGDDLVCDRLDDFRSSHEHVARILHHEDKISQRGRVDRTASAWAHDQGNLGDNAGGVDVALEDLCVTRQTVYTLLDASTARVVHANHRRTHKRSLVHDFADLLSVCLGQTTAHSREVLGVGKDNLSVDGSLACDAAIAWNLLLLHPELNTPVAL